jgi:hypothetical protein
VQFSGSLEAILSGDCHKLKIHLNAVHLILEKIRPVPCKSVHTAQSKMFISLGKASDCHMDRHKVALVQSWQFLSNARACRSVVLKALEAIGLFGCYCVPLRAQYRDKLFPHRAHASVWTQMLLTIVNPVKTVPMA